MEVLYNPAMITVKFSILLLYHRIFPSRKFKMILWAVAAFATCYTIASTFVLIFQCVPIQADWDIKVKRRCVNLEAAVISTGVLNALTDFVILGLPVRYIWRLHSSFAHKLQLMGMFLLGGFVCVTSIARVVAVTGMTFNDGSWVNTYPAIWSFIETSIAVISACLPTLRPVYKYVLYGKSGLSHVQNSPGRNSGDSEGAQLTKSTSPWQKRREPRDRLEASESNLGSEDGEKVPEAL
ncbi:MAG: hypothetical protein Q9213_000268 [Squamulea squamosa]